MTCLLPSSIPIPLPTDLGRDKLPPVRTVELCAHLGRWKLRTSRDHGMAKPHVRLDPPQPGQVIRYAYLWTSESDAGRDEAAKDRPCAVVLTLRQEAGDSLVFVLPITSRAPKDPADAIELSAATRLRLGLQQERCWIVLTEVNRFVWPGPDLRPVEQPVGGFYSFGLLPAATFRRARDSVLRRAREHRLRVVQRSE